MPYLRVIDLSDMERQELIHLRDHAPYPYLRERAAAILKVADGTPAAQVARSGLLRPRKPDTVYAWLDRFLCDGVAGLAIRAGRGRKPAFSPLYLDADDAAQELRHLVHRTPRACGVDQTRWTLAAIGRACDWLTERTLGCVERLLHRFGIVWKRARAAVRSPDPHYAAKLAAVTQLGVQARAQPGRLVIVYLDEVTIERQPTLANDYECQGPVQPRANRSHHSDTLTRVVATLEGTTGRVVFRRASKIRLATLVQFYQDLRAAYPDAERIYVVQDNWPVHSHPDLLVALEPQECQFAWHRPANWPTAPSATAVTRWGHLQLPIQIVPLPTYASWTNPIEKLWRKLRQDLTHLHQWADDLDMLRAEIDGFLQQFAEGSPALLQYVGLGLPD